MSQYCKSNTIFMYDSEAHGAVSDAEEADHMQ